MGSPAPERKDRAITAGRSRLAFAKPPRYTGAPPYEGSRRKMATFDDRKDAFERKFAHDEELRFKATARRNKLLGLWVAEKLGKSGAEADAYAKSVVMADFEEAGDDDVVRKVKKDLEDAGVSGADPMIRTAMIDLLERAIDEVKTGR
jgi:hypothetical protein